MSKTTELKLVHSNDEQPLSEALIRAIVIDDDDAKATEVIKRIKHQAVLSDASKPVSQPLHRSGE